MRLWLNLWQCCGSVKKKKGGWFRQIGSEEENVEPSTHLKTHPHVKVNSNVTFAQLTAVWWHGGAQVSHSECSGMADYGYVRDRFFFKKDWPLAFPSPSSSTTQHRHLFSPQCDSCLFPVDRWPLAAVWIMVLHTKLRCCLTQIRTLCVE